MIAARNPIGLVFALLALSCALATAKNAAERMESLNTALGVAMEEASKELKTKTDKLTAGYKKALTGLQERYTKNVDLDSALAVRAEITRIDELPVPVGADELSKVTGLADLQKKHAGAYKSLTAKHDQAMRALAIQHVAKLEKLKTELTVANDLDGAVAVRDMIQRMKKELADFAKMEKKEAGTNLAGLPAGAVLYFSFDKSEEDGRVLDRSGKEYHGESEMNSWLEEGKRGGGFAFTERRERV